MIASRFLTWFLNNWCQERKKLADYSFDCYGSERKRKADFVLLIFCLVFGMTDQFKQGYALKNCVEELTDEAFYPWESPKKKST